MKKFGFLVLSFLLAGSVSAQNMEYSIHLNSGIFSFGGESATNSSIIIVSDVATIDHYTNNPYGKEQALSYGLAAQIQRTTTGSLILGLQTGYEIVRSKVNIHGVSGEFPEPPSVTSGETTLSHGFIIVYPYGGKRFGIGNIKLDFTLGPEFAFNIFSRENGEATIGNNMTIETDTERNDPGTDIRIRPSLTVSYKNWGVSAGYSYGLHNYSGSLIGGDRERFSRFIRFGIQYKIN